MLGLTALGERTSLGQQIDGRPVLSRVEWGRVQG
jgi:hypothetical protein